MGAAVKLRITKDDAAGGQGGKGTFGVARVLRRRVQIEGNDAGGKISALEEGG